jgi:hypothetical protein
MGQRFVACDREQSFLMPPDVREWLPPRHLAWFVIDAVAEMNLDGFYAAYRVDGRSRPPYEPARSPRDQRYAPGVAISTAAQRSASAGAGSRGRAIRRAGTPFMLAPGSVTRCATSAAEASVRSDGVGHSGGAALGKRRR